MKVRALDKSLVPGYRTLTVLASLPSIVVSCIIVSSAALRPVLSPNRTKCRPRSPVSSQAIAPLKAQMPVTCLLDSGFDDVAVWRTIWEQHEHLVCRISHQERLVECADGQGG